MILSVEKGSNSRHIGYRSSHSRLKKEELNALNYNKSFYKEFFKDQPLASVKVYDRDNQVSVSIKDYTKLVELKDIIKEFGLRRRQLSSRDRLDYLKEFKSIRTTCVTDIKISILGDTVGYVRKPNGLKSIATFDNDLRVWVYAE